MKSHFKPYICAMNRYQTSTGRDLEEGLRLDRNERVADAGKNVLNDIWSKLPSYVLHVTPDVGGLYKKIAGEHGISADTVYIGQGITECTRFMYETLTKPGENVVVLDPTYPMYWIYAQMFQVEYRKFTYGTDHKPDWDTLYANVDEKTAMVVVANPNLPVESAFVEGEIRRLAEFCKERDVVLAVDEAYHGFGSYSAMDLVGEYDNLVVLRTFSKAWGLAAIRLGYMVSQPQNIEYISKTRSLVETNALSMHIAMYALEHQNLRDEHVREVKEGATYLWRELDALGLKWHGGEFTNGILIFMNSAAESKALFTYMRERKIYIRGSFEAPYDTCVRASIGPAHIMSRFVGVLKEWQDAGRLV